MSQTDPTQPASAEAQPMEFRAEVQQLLQILAHSLYTNREIFLRELISNASDALNRLQFEMLTQRDLLDPDAELAITINMDQEARTLTISDTGIGMNRDELVSNLGTIAHSGAAAFLKSIQDENRPAEDIIGQFGVGFYSVFMVAEEVTVTTRSYRLEDQAWAWTSSGGNAYDLAPAEKPDRGTTITIKLKEDASEFTNSWRLGEIIKKHSNYVSYPIYLDGNVANQRTALWRESPQDVEAGQYDEFYKQLTLDTENPLLHMHLVTDAPVNIRSILYVPARRERSFLGLRTDTGLKLYSRKILIQEYNQDLLPKYFRFVDGVIDSEDIPLNISRETVQSNPMMRQISRVLSKRLVKELGAMAEDRPDDYRRFWQEFGAFLKEGIATDPESHADLADLLRFHSSRAAEEDEMVSLQEYVSRMQEEQEHIFYVLGDNLKAAARSPHLDYFRANDIEVLYLLDPLDSFMAAAMREYNGKPLQNVDDPTLELPSVDSPDTGAEDSLPQDEFDTLLERFTTVLGDQVTGVQESHRLTDSPCRLASSESGPERDMARVRRFIEQEYEAPRKSLEINRQHPLIQNLARLVNSSPGDGLIDTAIWQMYDNAMLLEGEPLDPADMTPRIQALMEAAIASRLDS